MVRYREGNREVSRGRAQACDRKCSEHAHGAQYHPEEKTVDTVELEIGEEAADVLEFSSIPKSALTGWCANEPLCIASPWRQLF